MRDPRERLDREVLGDSVLGPRKMLVKAIRENVVPERIVTVPERTGGRVVQIRSYRHVPEPGPNAPKLIRLIRTPVQQELARPLPLKGIQRRAATEWMKPDSARMVREALAGRERATWPKATRESARVPDRPRLSAAAWLESDEGGA